jgi:hypothetical protein
MMHGVRKKAISNSVYKDGHREWWSMLRQDAGQATIPKIAQQLRG